VTLWILDTEHLFLLERGNLPVQKRLQQISPSAVAYHPKSSPEQIHRTRSDGVLKESLRSPHRAFHNIEVKVVSPDQDLQTLGNNCGQGINQCDALVRVARN
jgi:hypothetical protein